jgi:hypothetical protein
MSAYIYFYGYNCYGYGCLAEPPGVQLQDPNPLPDIEADYVPPTTYTSTRSFTAKCPAGTVQNNPQALISLAVNGTQPYPNSDVVDAGSAVDIASGIITTSVSDAAFLSVQVNVYGSNDNVNFDFIAVNANLSSGQSALNVLTPGTYRYFYMAIIPIGGAILSRVGTYSVSLAGPAGSNAGITRSSTQTSIISQADADNKALSAATLAANTALAAVGCSTQYSSTQTATVKCPAGQYDGNNGNGATANGSATSFVSQNDADALALTAATANAQSLLNCSNSNNTQAITINDYPGTGPGQPASPYPSVSFISGLTGLITRIRVNLIGYHHGAEGDVQMLLKSPSGKVVELMRHCGGLFALNTPTNITLDSNSATPLPASATFAGGAYKPTQYAPSYTWPSPAPQTGYLADFSTLIGDLPNGAWSLWIADIKALDIGAVDGGWSLTLDTA